METITDYYRICECGNIVYYKTKKGLQRANTPGKKCILCQSIGRPSKTKGMTFEQIYGIEKASHLKSNLIQKNTGKTHTVSAEAREKIRSKNKGRKFSQEHRDKLSKAKKGAIPWNKGVGLENHIIQQIAEKTKLRGVSYETRLKISKANTGKKRSVEHIAKLREGHNNYTITDEHRNKISLANKGKIVSIETRIKLSKANKGIPKKRGRKCSEETKRKISAKLVGRKFSMTMEHKKNIRIATLKYLENRVGQLFPRYNLKGCECFNKIMEETNTFIQHAENGGEYHIKELGYWVDGYDKENNIVYEYDEPYHFNIDGSLRNKDINRQTEIEKFLKCKFIRIKST